MESNIRFFYVHLLSGPGYKQRGSPMGCINSKATVHPASLDDDDDDVVVSRPSVSPPAQDGAGDAVAQLNEKIVSESTREVFHSCCPFLLFLFSLAEHVIRNGTPAFEQSQLKIPVTYV